MENLGLMEESDCLNFLSITQSPEQELRLEWDVRQILKCEDRKELAEMCVGLYRQNWAKDQIIKNCLGRIGDLEGHSIKMQLNNERPWWRKLLKR
jgi:hypothetical protein